MLGDIEDGDPEEVGSGNEEGEALELELDMIVTISVELPEFNDS